jgi:hypothetical protein
MDLREFARRGQAAQTAMDALTANEEQLLALGTRELAGLMESGAGVQIEMAAVEAFHLVAALQLALRHPGMGHTTRESIEALARFVERKFKPYPAVAEMIRRGWDPKFDTFGEDIKR